jgi:hypothetical protein
VVTVGDPGIGRVDDGFARCEEGEQSRAECTGGDVFCRTLPGAVAQTPGLVVVAAVDDHTVG